MEAAGTFEMSVNFYQATQHSHPEDSHLHVGIYVCVHIAKFSQIRFIEF
jgi:hypothetical protein